MSSGFATFSVFSLGISSFKPHSRYFLLIYLFKSKFKQGKFLHFQISPRACPSTGVSHSLLLPWHMAHRATTATRSLLSS